MDSQTVKTTETSGERGWDGEKKVKGRKRHLITDTCGWPLEVWVPPANVQEREIGAEMLDLMKLEHPSLAKVWVDSAYAGLVEEVRRKIGVDVEVVRRPRDQKGFQVLPRRWVIERSFGWLNRYRRLSKDFEYWDENSASMVKISSIHLMLKRWALLGT